MHLQGALLGALIGTLLVPQPAQTLECYHSTCADGTCTTVSSQYEVETVLTDCSQHTETLFPGGDAEQQLALSSPGLTRSNADFDACQKVLSDVNGFDMALYSCASTSRREKHRFRCHRDEYGDEPWNVNGSTVASRFISTTTWCCDSDGCNSPPSEEDLASEAAAAAAAAAAAVEAAVFQGWQYRQDPAWQGGTRNCICEWTYEDPCTETPAFNPLFQLYANYLGRCVA
eukprot:SAG11_NODE_10_length_27955_cov_15.365235_23_plen_230_part_00